MMAPVQSRDEARTLIDALLEEQRDLPAVERFARWHEANANSLAPSHRALIPLTAPAAGEQYAFEVDLDRCSGCKSCVAACHALNGLDEDETWRGVGTLHGRGRNSFQQTITTACHHCVEPGCLEGCPVLAYDKDPLTGIVRHLDDQCIGCQYCVFMCPYEVPKYSERRGIVRKCDMCHQRLAHGEAPACVQACPSEAIRITVVEAEAVRVEYRSKLPAEKTCSIGTPNRFLPDSPEPAITLPTTRYVSARPLSSDLLGGRAHDLELEPAHTPLIWMLVLTQLGAGGFVILPFSELRVQPVLAVVALVATVAGCAASFFHLGRPQKAWRVFLGLRRSWMSREIVAFGLFVILAAAVSVKLVSGDAGGPRSMPLTFLQGVTALLGVAAVICSGMTYHVTQRECWRGELSVGRFLGTALVLGTAVAWWVSTLLAVEHRYFAVSLALATLAKLSRELNFLQRCPDDADLDYELPAGLRARSAFLMRFRLGVQLRLRIACGWVGGVGLPLLSLLPDSATRAVAATGMLLCVAGELIERALFFRTVVVSKMPGSAGS